MRRDPLANPEPLIRRVYAYAACRIGDGPDPEDVTSNTFERAVRYGDSFDLRRGDVAAWLIGIARREIGFHALDDADRELIALRYSADLTAPQIGEVLGRKTDAVEAALHRTLRKLRGELEAPPAPSAIALPEVTLVQ